jgi:ubiquitin-conjugating enzyme E2 I
VSYDWKPSISIKQILMGVQTLMEEPNVKSVANHDVYVIFQKDRRLYEADARRFAATQKPPV